VTEPVVDMLADEWQRLTELCSSLRPEHWSRPTDCPGWTVQDQLAHVVGTESMLAGHPAPADPAHPLTHVKNEIGVLNEAWVESLRGCTPDELLSRWKEVSTERQTQLRSFGTERFDELGPSPVGAVPYREFMRVRVMDCWVHEQDIRRAVDRPGHRSGPIVSHSLHRFADAMPFVVGKKAKAPEGSTVLFDLTGEAARRVAVRVEGGRASLVDDHDVDRATTTIRMDAETWWVLALGRRAPADARAGGGITVEGDRALGDAVVDCLPFMI
jgi:uncharacterized protein (TIGR03083 family)